MTSNRYLKWYVTIKIMQPAAISIFTGKKAKQTNQALYWKKYECVVSNPRSPNYDPAAADTQVRLPWSLKPRVVCLQSDVNLVFSGDRSINNKDLAVVLKPYAGWNSCLKTAFWKSKVRKQVAMKCWGSSCITSYSLICEKNERKWCFGRWVVNKTGGLLTSSTQITQHVSAIYFLDSSCGNLSVKQFHFSGTVLCWFSVLPNSASEIAAVQILGSEVFC